MPAKLELEGNRYGQLSVIEEFDSPKNRSVLWLCICDCGNFTISEASKLVKQIRSCSNCASGSLAATIVGKKFGYLEVIECFDVDKYNKRWWLCICDCGQLAIRNQGHLLRNYIQQCRQCAVHDNGYKHGHTRKNTKISHVYISWQAMKSRCYNPKNKDFKSYGGRGITVCDAWKSSFINFLKWAQFQRFYNTKGYTLDRKDVNDNYYPENCRFADAFTQARNKRRAHIVI